MLLEASELEAAMLVARSDDPDQLMSAIGAMIYVRLRDKPGIMRRFQVYLYTQWFSSERVKVSLESLARSKDAMGSVEMLDLPADVRRVFSALRVERVVRLGRDIVYSTERDFEKFEMKTGIKIVARG
jgi:hypothetical protein